MGLPGAHDKECHEEPYEALALNQCGGKMSGLGPFHKLGHDMVYRVKAQWALSSQLYTNILHGPWARSEQSKEITTHIVVR